MTGKPFKLLLYERLKDADRVLVSYKDFCVLLDDPVYRRCIYNYQNPKMDYAQYERLVKENLDAILVKGLGPKSAEINFN